MRYGTWPVLSNQAKCRAKEFPNPCLMVGPQYPTIYCSMSEGNVGLLGARHDVPQQSKPSWDTTASVINDVVWKRFCRTKFADCLGCGTQVKFEISSALTNPDPDIEHLNHLRLLMPDSTILHAWNERANYHWARTNRPSWSRHCVKQCCKLPLHAGQLLEGR